MNRCHDRTYLHSLKIEQSTELSPTGALLLTRIFTGQPNFANAFVECLLGSSYNFFQRITHQITARMFRFAISALVQTSGIYCNDFDERIFSNFWQRQCSTGHSFTVHLFLLQQSNAVENVKSKFNEPLKLRVARTNLQVS